MRTKQKKETKKKKKIIDKFQQTPEKKNKCNKTVKHITSLKQKFPLAWYNISGDYALFISPRKLTRASELILEIAEREQVVIKNEEYDIKIEHRTNDKQLQFWNVLLRSDTIGQGWWVFDFSDTSKQYVIEEDKREIKLFRLNDSGKDLFFDLLTGYLIFNPLINS